jgi:ferredoxin
VADATRVYACGPETLLTALEALSAAWLPGTLQVERFRATVSESSAPADAFEVECKRTGLTVTVPADGSILATLEQAGVPVSGSCLEGVCGTCETAVISGEPDHRDAVLSPEERAANETMLICVSRSCGRRLVLDI